MIKKIFDKFGINTKNKQFKDFNTFDLRMIKHISKKYNSEISLLTETEKDLIDIEQHKIINFETLLENKYEVIKELKRNIDKTSYQVFSIDFGSFTELAIEPKGENGKICILRSEDKFDILRSMKTKCTNHDIDTEKLIEKFKEWDEKYGVEIFGANFDWVHFKLKSLPSELTELAEEIAAFCPDILDNGIETVEKLERFLDINYRDFVLWWD